MLNTQYVLQVSFFTNNKLQEEKRQSNGLFGIFGL